MSVLFSESAQQWIPVAVFGASLLGSGHCLAMCGGLVVSMARSPRATAFYHLGRLAGYLALGATAGWLGQKVLLSTTSGWLSWIATGALALGFIALGVRSWIGRGMHLSLVPTTWLQRLYPWTRDKPVLAGTLSAFLPCGWLHSFVLASVATRTPFGGALVLLFFWLGTLPALTAAPFLFQRLLRPLVERSPRISAAVLILIGVLCVGGKVLSGIEASHAGPAQAEAQCHSSHH